MNTPRIFTLLAVLAIAFVACEDPDELGLGLLPASDKLNVHFADTATITCDVHPGDSIATSGILITHLLGSFSDPQFGRSDASIYGQLVFGRNPVLGDATEILTADSLVLSLEYSTINTFANYYGNISTPMKFSVYRLTEAMSKDSVYYSNRHFATEPVPIGTATIVPAPDDSVYLYGVKKTPQLRIRLSTALASELLALNGTDTFETTTAWLDYFKGLYIKTEPVNGIGEGSLLQLYLFGSYSAMTLYYHSDTPGDDSLQYSFLFNTTRMNHYDHEFGTSDAGKQIQDSSYNPTVNYVQGMAGVRTRIRFPHLDDLAAQGGIAIDKAEITIPAEESELYIPPSYIRLLAIDSIGRSYLTSDFVNEGTFFGGGYDLTNKYYKFNITRQLQAYIDGKQGNYGFYVVVPYLATTTSGTGTTTYYRMQPNRVIISSAANTARPVTLNITYTKLP